MAFPTISVNDVIQITLKGRLFGQRTNNTFFYIVTAEDGSQTFTEVFQQWAVDFETLWCNMVSEDWTGDTVTLRRLKPIKTRGVDFNIEWVGAVASPSLPPSTAAVISRWNYASGPRNRGRIFIPGIATSHHADGELTAPAMAILTLLAAQMDDPLEDVPDFSLAPVLYHRATNSAAVVEATTPRKTLRQQRRREIGVGE